MLVRFPRKFSKLRVYLAYIGTALPPLEDWLPEHIERWRLSLPDDDRVNFKEFFDKVIAAGAKGSTLASYNLEALLLVFPKLGVFAPELYARLQALKRKGTP